MLSSLRAACCGRAAVVTDVTRKPEGSLSNQVHQVAQINEVVVLMCWGTVLHQALGAASNTFAIQCRSLTYGPGRNVYHN